MNTDEPIIVDDTGGADNKPLPTEGLVAAVCAYAADVGYEENHFTPGKMQRKVIIGFELNERISGTGGEMDGKRFLLSKFYTASLNEKANLYRDLGTWLGKKNVPSRLDLRSLVGKNCTLNVAHVDKAEKTYANIAGIAPPMQGVEPMQVELEAIPEWVMDRGRKNHGLATPTTENKGAFDEVPF